MIFPQDLFCSLGECYLLEFYPGGQALAYYGYASFGEKEYQAYRIPAGTEETVAAYILDNGTLERSYAASFSR